MGRAHNGHPGPADRHRAVSRHCGPGGRCGAGAATYEPRGQSWEISCLFSLCPGRGIGTALLAAVVTAAWRAGARRVWLVTTNDNLHALGFYQRRGWSLAAVHLDALDAARRLKPGIPDIGMGGIPLRHEFELEWIL